MGKKKGKEQEAPPKDEFDPLDLTTKKAQTVVLMLASPEDGVLQRACEALFKFSEKCDENKEQLLNLGALDYLLKLILHEDKTVKRNATMAIGSMATNSIVRKSLRNLDCIQSLIALLGPEEDVLCHEFSSLAMASMAEEFASKVEIFEKGGLEPLINLLSSSDCDVQRNSIQAIALLLQDYQSRAAFQELNGIEPVLKLLDSDYPVIQELALHTLNRASMDTENRIAIRDLGGMDKLVDVIGKKEFEDLHVLCLQVLSNCLKDIESVQHVQSTGVFSKLLAFIAESTNTEVQKFAATVIAACCKSEDNRRIFHEQETEKTLITLLTGESAEVSMAAAKALAAMSENLSSRDYIGKLEGIPTLIGMLKTDSADLKEAVSLALANLSSGNANNCTEIVEKGGLDALIKLLPDNKPSLQGYAAVCLTNLAQDESWRSDMLRLGVISGLVIAMQSNDTDVQNKACHLLSALLCDNDARSELFNENGLSHLINLLKSNHDSVRRNASWALTMCCVDNELSAEVTKLGGLSILQDLNQSNSRKSPFTEAALERVLDSNLSAKYSLTGVLKSDNIITDGFYDLGRVKEGSDIPSLEILSKNAVDQRRPIFLINIAKHKTNNNNNKPKIPIPRIEAPQPPSDKTSSIKPAKSRVDARSKSRMKDEKTNNEDNQQRHQEISQPTEVGNIKKKSSIQWHPPFDEKLAKHIDHCKEKILTLETTRKQIEALSIFVSSKMGGPIPKDEVPKCSFELPISQLKLELNSNVIPIGEVQIGIYYHRALLFKAIADRIGISCSLVRGDYGRAWNEVRLCKAEQADGVRYPPETYIVDLMHNPGELFLQGSPAAVSYQRI
ncbi:armadillo repeat-containing protein 3-like isoform X1 [Rhopilema esculentum]|uniref:armadillo repeat-containing protein 3-like isoform X1 n=1 Tax=Rhopilema esculentum TaxID=499914 RepID=UPI0031D16F24